MKRSLAICVAAALVIGTACREATAPLITGLFVLTSVGGEPLPAATMTQGSEIVVADTMVFINSMGSRGFRQVEHRAGYRNPDGTLRSVVYRLEYEFNGNDVVFLAPPCPNPAFTECVFVPRSGQALGTELTVTFANAALRQQVFVRADD